MMSPIPPFDGYLDAEGCLRHPAREEAPLCANCHPVMFADSSDYMGGSIHDGPIKGATYGEIWYWLGTTPPPPQ